MSLLLQDNLNHAREAQDLLVHSLAELGGCLAVAAEPYSVPDHPSWLGSRDGSVALYFRWGHASIFFSPLEKGEGFVACKWGELAIVGCYFSPTRPFHEFEEFLNGLERVIRRLQTCPLLVLGDFNAKSVTWGSPRTDVRERVLEECMAACSFATVNEDTQHTCVRRNGGSIVDVTFASPSAIARVSEWKVKDDLETLSDHRYITMKVSELPGPPRGRHEERRHPRSKGGSLESWTQVSCPPLLRPRPGQVHRPGRATSERSSGGSARRWL
ncbi:uncharacterized protein LOC109862204 [Pseudomyrmex gracilis]|uniref:uncharacterized protein LOC109862204 n=1 Tax=Pseudomyrmex gracilis TaxID=219809 RepID=UPI0009951968|nr:uncharacterized protein LOC109862204 [Pseudomyrmex gracilis]